MQPVVFHLDPLDPDSAVLGNIIDGQKIEAALQTNGSSGSTSKAGPAAQPVSSAHLFFSRVAPSKMPPALHRNFPFHLSLLHLHSAPRVAGRDRDQRVPPHEPLHRPASAQQIRATVFLGLSSALFFMSYNVSQNYITTLHAQVGAIALLCVYVSFCVFLLLSCRVC